MSGSAVDPYTVELFRQLNEEFRSDPLVPKPPERSTAGFERVAAGRIDAIAKHIDVAGKTVLELGTGRGYTAALLASASGAARVIGTDIRAYPEWELHDPRSTEFILGDLASGTMVETESIDAVVSAVVLEHVSRPIPMLEQIHRILRPGGEAWLYFNLYRGPKASHRYHDVFFPWPHLLFDAVGTEDVVRRATASKGQFAWVNRMTAAHYLQVCAEVGFEIKTVRRHAVDLARFLDFYIRFEDKLGRYPALDLETDFLTIVIEKRPGPVDRVPRLEYATRQARLDGMVDRRKAAFEAAVREAGPGP